MTITTSSNLVKTTRFLDSCNTLVLDWSRYGRQKRVIEDAGSDPNQSHIEDYFQTANEIDVLIHENDKLSNLLRQYEFNSTANYTQIEFNSFPNMLQHIICNAMKNAEKLPKGQRYLEIVKKFATSLFIYTGPFAYHFLQQNVSLALPSLRSI